MPPKKRKRGSGELAGHARKRREASSVSSSTSSPLLSSLLQPTTSNTPNQQQIKGFTSQQELAKHAISLGLKRVMLTDLHQQSDLQRGYVGGQVMGHCSLPLSQGHDLNIFIQDESTTEGSQSKHLKVTICEEVAERMPVLRDDAKLFLHKPLVREDDIEVSQDHGKCLLVDKTETEVWIVHKDAKKPSFFSEKSCGKKWWGRTKKRRKKMQAMWSAESASVGGNLKEPSVTGRTGLSSAAGPSNQPSIPGARRVIGEGAPVDDSLSQSQSQDSTFPDNTDFPDSAFTDSSVPSNSSSDDTDDSDREWTVRLQHNTEATGREYTYQKLEDLRIGDVKVNVIGVVKEFKPPALTRGSDYYSTLTLVDETNPRVGIKCIMFNKAPEKHPQLKSIGDIVCLHRINVIGYNGVTQLQGLRYCSCIRFSGYVGRKLAPSTGSVSFTCTLLERRRVRDLREWARKQRREKSLCPLKYVVPDTYFDMACQIVSVTISKVPKCVVLGVWDGTPHTLNCRELRLEKWYDEGYPIVKDDPELSEDTFGYETHVVVYNKKCMRKASELVPGQFVYLQNLHLVRLDIESGNLLEICMQRVDEPLLDTLPPRVELFKPHDELLTRVKERMEHAVAMVTTTRHHRQPLCTIAEITSHTQPLPAKFHCRARVLRVNSPSLEDMVLVHCSECDHTEVASLMKKMDENGVLTEPCSNCIRLGKNAANSGRPTCFFYFKMTVGDRSGEMEVEIANEEAIYLFNNLKPNNLYQYQDLRYKIMEKLYFLTGGNTPFCSPTTMASAGSSQVVPRPWADFCILAAEHDKIIYYCLMDTKLKQP